MTEKRQRARRIGAWLLTFAVCAATMVSLAAMSPVPKESAKALGSTKSKPFSSGLVFINGSYIEPPYVVERWGTGIRINGRNATGQIIDWEEFLKTQSGVKAVKSTDAQPGGAATAAAQAEAKDVESSLDDLFADDPEEGGEKKPKKTAKKKPKAPKPTVTYSLEGDFVPNEQSKALVAKINVVRKDIDTQLRSGGFVFFGDRYSRVVGNDSTAEELLAKLPELLRTKESAKELEAAVRSAGFVFLNERICADLYRHRVDYLKLQRRRESGKQDRAVRKMMKNAGGTY